MSKKLLLIASTCFILCTFSKNVLAQETDLFNLPDTVCMGHEIEPFDVVEASGYSWSFCPPDLGTPPTGGNLGAVSGINLAQDIVLASDNNILYSFALNTSGEITRYKFEDGYEEQPTLITTLANIQNAKGMHMVHTDIWSIFIFASSPNGAKLSRLDFENGLSSLPTIVDLGSLHPDITSIKELYITKDNNEGWFGVSFTENDELLILKFGMNVQEIPTITNLGNIENNFSGVSDITAVNENGNWHAFVTNKTNHKLLRISFGNSFNNIPFVIDLGDFNGRLRQPTGISIAGSCEGYYGYVLNQGSASLINLKWAYQSIADFPTGNNHGNVAGFTLPTALSDILTDSGKVYMLASNHDNSISHLTFLPCETSSIPSSDLKNPAVSYNTPGLYTITLTLDNGESQCKEIYISDRPDITISNDTLICQGDSIRLSILAYEVDSFRWSPDYNINTIEGQFVTVWPEFSTNYTVTSYFAENCIVKSPIDITVSRITADAGPDRIISDGSETILGGPKTTLGTNYTYEWIPDIGITGSTGTPVTTAIPPYNLTYYLNVYNTDGCHLIDSVLVYAPCDDVNLPNAFVPGSAYPESNKFGLKNLQFVKINYFSIYDRWGKEVFTTTDVHEAWDGTIDGSPAPMGVYVWQVDANCANTQQRFRKSGNVTLIR